MSDRGRAMKLFSYVVEHDTGDAPNPYFGFCTLCRCKYRKDPAARLNVVELAKRAMANGEVVWVVGTGGANPNRSAGNGKLVYAMRVDEVLTRGEYYKDPRFERKKLPPNGDNVRPKGIFETHEQYALVSRHFYYFGNEAIEIPVALRRVEKRGRGFRSRFDCAFVERFVRWIECHKRGLHGQPWMEESVALMEARACKSYC